MVQVEAEELTEVEVVARQLEDMVRDNSPLNGFPQYPFLLSPLISPHLG